MRPIRIGIIGFGKIAREQHVPSIAGYPRFELAATGSRGGNGQPGVPCFADHRAMIRDAELDAVAICTPPSVRYEIARDCLEAGLHCLLEKPPGVSLGEVEELARIAGAREMTLFTTWHTQANPAVGAAAKLLAGERIASMEVIWHEDVRKWHPGQDWIWEPGGFGVFDPGINALSIVAQILPGALFVRDAELTYPANKQSPIAAELSFASPASDGALTASFDWRHSGGEAWTIDIRTEAGRHVRLLDGGGRLEVDGAPRPVEGAGEYPALYGQFLDLIDERRSHVDLRPLRLVADAFLVGRRTATEPFED
ncbi:MAG TPA: Gfo/Idh/MocA family oxidoreductase [Allosphingosinicella sp.]|jgi:predicted dehydrogenase|uniref:Gfo/Idh/MocA family protein n=1 Tax=Allosphingosinicella sp. TaxID=2823234 RepID=UPI002F2A13EB